MLTGWHLLNGAGLNATERSAIIANASTKLGPDATLETIDITTMERALQLAWPDSELKERDEKQEKKDTRNKSKRSAFNVQLNDASSDSGTDQEPGQPVTTKPADAEADAVSLSLIHI